MILTKKKIISNYSVWKLIFWQQLNFFFFSRASPFGRLILDVVCWCRQKHGRWTFSAPHTRKIYFFPLCFVASFEVVKIPKPPHQSWHFPGLGPSFYKRRRKQRLKYSSRALPNLSYSNRRESVSLNERSHCRCHRKIRSSLHCPCTRVLLVSWFSFWFWVINFEGFKVRRSETHFRPIAGGSSLFWRVFDQLCLHEKNPKK